MSASSRERVVGCPAMLTTLGTELSSHVASDSAEASDRAAVQTPCCHGVQRNADGIRVSHVRIVADGPYLDLSQECKNCGKSWTCKKKPPEIHAPCKSCINKQQTIPDDAEVGGVVKIARTLIDVFPCVSGTGYIKEIELSAVESPPSEYTGCCDVRTNTESYSACKQNVSIIADGPISGEQLVDSKRPETITKDSRQDEVGEELCYQSGAGSPPHMQSFLVKIIARSKTATPRGEHVKIVADSLISGLVDDDTSNGEEEGESSDISSDYNSESDNASEDKGEEIWYDAINGHKCRW